VCRIFASVRAADSDFAGRLGYTIKLLGVSEVFDAPAAAAAAAAAATAAPALQRRLLDVFVSPALVPARSPLGQTGGALNLVQVASAALGETSFAGAGAGRFATANSVLADLFAIAKRTNTRRAPKSV
jgi:homoserine dehydrogenase